MRGDAILDLLLLEADGGLSPVDVVRLETALADHSSLQAERASVRAAWRELQALGRGIAMPREPGADGIAAHSASAASELMTPRKQR